ncbi:MAG: preprotein translocase subunit SecG [Pseudomonadota bacterium]|nr:preprotein translocase subunit SecG [Pseudomonadota bacterium]
MHWLTNILMTVQVLSAIGVITLVLLQHGKGADMGAAFGGGASGSLFGATGSANFLSRTTGFLAAVFFASTLGLALLVNTRQEAPASVMDTVPTGSQVDGQSRPAPATPADVPADVPSSTPADVPRDVPAAPAGNHDATQENREATDIPK